MARAGGTVKSAAAAAALLLVLLTIATVVGAVAPEMTTAAGGGSAATAGRRGLRRVQPMGLAQCVAGCGTTVTSCLLDCYGPTAGAGDRSLLPICLLDCTNNAMFCATDCSTQALK